ncbi:murein hydrolase activator EnvC [Microbacterium sp. T2.11-28]|uniref:murein hydrolase activator EnvC family protein n=1 Tax=Microbacterium sp. T2.11-28 TaxID=3041169 RepID=UPI002477B84D|nr:M23 family metallopeptidase [Microbacterium sp. T2.11-28]CAI9386349.1 hypothetical protein MICABA_00330 [Microbacterium sp. T2.11-28]
MRTSLRPRRLAGAVLLVLLGASPPSAAGAVPDGIDRHARAAVVSGEEEARAPWQWPTAPVRVVAAYDAPAHEFAAGHRGVDVLAAAGTPLRAPADGVVVFAGTVVDRDVVTIDHGDGHVSTLEPVHAVVRRGAQVRAGDVVARAAAGGHAAPGSVHLGVRRHGRYIDPLELLGPLPRAVLLPCC